MTSADWLAGAAPALLRPMILLSIGIYHFVMTMLEVVFYEWSPFTLLNITKLRHKAFVRFWKHNGKALSVDLPGPSCDMLAQCKGVILDVGPGSGEMLRRFDPNLIVALYAAEPAEGLHPGLLKNAEKTGLKSKLHPMVCGAEPESLIPALHKSGILDVSGKGGLASEGVFDEICCTRVLCGVPHPEQTIKGLYNLLKPGGRMVISEHVASPWRTEGSVVARFMQLVYTIMGWPFFMGGCELQRHTFEYLRDAGEWDKFDLQYYNPKDCIPWVVGELIKKHEELDKSYAEVVKE